MEVKLDINIVPSKTKLKNESGYWPMLSALVIVWLTEMSSAKNVRLIADKKKKSQTNFHRKYAKCSGGGLKNGMSSAKI